MSDANDPKRRLSEISHLFLSSVRDRQTDGRPMPSRTPPKKQPPAPPHPADISVDLTADEYATAFDETFAPPGGGGACEQPERIVVDGGRTKPVTAVLAPHLDGGLLDAARQYAGHRCAAGDRVGVIFVDPPAMRLFRFEPDGDGQTFDESDAEADAGGDGGESDVDARRLAEALVEMDADVDRWLLVLADPAAAEARVTLGAAGRWVVLSTADHDGVIGAYRSIKQLLAPVPGDVLEPVGRPAVGLALLDAASVGHAGRIHGKIAAACEQFLGLPLANDPPADFNANVSELPVLTCGGGDTPVTASAAFWEVLYDFIESGPAEEVEEIDEVQAAEPPRGVGVPPTSPAGVSPASLIQEKAQARAGRPSDSWAGRPRHEPATAADDPWVARPAPTPAELPEPTMPQLAALPAAALSAAPSAPLPGPFLATAPLALAADTVLDLPADAGPAAVIAAVLKASPDLAAAPVAPPVLPSAAVAVSRHGRLTLLAAADGGADLRPIVAGFRWLAENRPLLAMAMPQFKIDPAAEPHLRLFVDRLNGSAEALRPLLRDDQVTVRTYRTLRWGEKTGLLLEAA